MIDINFLTRNFFYFDLPVKFQLKNKQEISIYPIKLIDSEYFLSSIDLLMIDKNAASDVNIIQMSYLKFLCSILLQIEDNKQKFVNILLLNLGLKNPSVKVKDNKFYLVDLNEGIEISEKDFEDIRRIILYQNIIHFDDSYINPELKEAMNEVDQLKNQNIVIPSTERKIAIITAHTGLSKKEQLEMTFRSHTLLFEEVSGEVDFSTTRSVALFTGNGDKMGHWIYKNKTDKFEGYITDVDKYAKSMGQEHNGIKTSNSNVSDNYLKQFNNF